MEPCINNFWGTERHNFKPRYDTVAPNWMNNTLKLRADIDIKELYEQHYICDVCVNCGAVIYREAQRR